MSDYLARLLDLADKASVWREEWRHNPGFTPSDTDIALIAAVDDLPAPLRATEAGTPDPVAEVQS